MNGQWEQQGDITFIDVGALRLIIDAANNWRIIMPVPTSGRGEDLESAKLEALGAAANICAELQSAIITATFELERSGRR
jgi:hypothetical protein